MLKLKRYLRSRLRLLVMLACFAVVCAGIFWLWRLPLETVLYAALICLVVGAIFAVLDYIYYLHRHAVLSDTAVILNDENALPEPRTLIEEDYDTLLRAAAAARREAQTEAGREQAELTEYFTLWAHQVKIPISAMRLILQNEDTDLSRELEAQLFMTEQYVSMVLAYLRTTGDGTDYVLRECPLDEVVRSSVRRFAAMFIRRRLVLDLRPITETVLTDSKWLSFVIDQILSNAIKYTPRGSVTLRTEKCPGAPDGNSVVLVIEDTGIGISPEDLPRIFERTYTGRNGREDRSATGLGLYLSRQILNRLGHTISVTSVPDAGTAVRIALPPPGGLARD